MPISNNQNQDLIYQNILQDNTKIYQVSQFNQQIQNLLESNFASVYIEGEVSSLSKPMSGHLYFSLKDAQSQIRCALFRNINNKLKFTIENGMKILVQAKVSLYTTRGDYQLIIQHVFATGIGKLQLLFIELKNKLQLEGLFNPEHKQSLPENINTIGIITSQTGAAICDILTTLKRRYPIANIIIYPCLVQGNLAAKQIIAALNLANEHNKADLLILARGGGSFEDLYCFNDEQLARTIFNSKIPIVTGIGHESDFTIADLVADLRAPTPTAAAELSAPNIQDIYIYLNNLQLNLAKYTKLNINKLSEQLTSLQQRLNAQKPEKQIILQQQTLDYLSSKLIKNINLILQNYYNQLQLLSQNLNTLSPLNILSRGYSITTKKNNNKIITNINQVNINDIINIKLHTGKLIAKIIKYI